MSTAPYRVALAASLAIHLILLFVVTRSPAKLPIDLSQTMEISIEPPAPLRNPQVSAKQQIVSPPQTKEETEPSDEPKRFLSERDTSVPKEQIKRGAGEDAGPIVDKQPGPPQPPAPRAAQEKPQPKAVEKQPLKEQTKPERSRSEPPKPKSESPKKQPSRSEVPPNESPIQPEGRVAANTHPLKTLSLDSATTMAKFGDSGQQPGKKSNSAKPRPFSRPPGSGAAFFGQQGSLDLIPNLPDGDITLLNAKADQFAVFVRRVALQVFAQLRTSGWEYLSYRDVNQMERDTMVRATLARNGSLESVTLETQSGSGRFDTVVLDAAKKGTRDPNPPDGARAADGKIHFIFQARSWSQPATDPRSGAPTERRWLMLGTGLE